MRLLVAHSSYRLVGGEDMYVQRQVQLLRPHHHVILLQRSNQTLKSGVRVALRMAWSPTATRAVENAIDAAQPEVVHLHNAYPSLGPAVHLAAERRGVPLVMTVHNARLRCPNGLMFTQGSICRRCERGRYANAVLHDCFPSRSQATAYAAGLWLHRFPLALERRVALYVAPSAFMARQLLRWGIPGSRVEVVPNFTPLRPEASAEPGSYGLYLGRLSAEKGLDILLRALRLAGDPSFRIAGAGPLEPTLRELASQLRLRNTEFMGQLGRSDVNDVVEAARIVVLPSVWDENAPMAALEAMAAGRPLVVSEVGGLPELVESGAGVRCKAGDVPMLARAIADLMRDDRRCRDAGARALKHSEANLDPEVHRRRLETAYGKAAEMARAVGSST